MTTTQKLSDFVSVRRGHKVYSGHVVLIFDGYHRSQSGDIHVAIAGAFTNYHLFDFTGTPIFTEDTGSGNMHLRTTERAFSEQLHSYMILNAVGDNNVLPFHIGYIDIFHRGDTITDQQAPGIDTVTVYRDPRRISQIVSYILEHFDQKTKRRAAYSADGRRLRGFNLILATESITAARDYYAEFTRQ